MPGRSFKGSLEYRFGFNGKENDKDWGGQLIQDYGFRLYNPAIGKFLSVDPLAPEYPWYTPYQFAGNMPIWAIDLDGLEPSISTTEKKETLQSKALNTINTTSTPAPIIPGPAPGVGIPGAPINTPGPAGGTGSPGGVRPPGGPGLAPPVIGMSAAAVGTIAIASLSVASDTRPKNYITLYRGINVEHGRYGESKQGIVTPNYMRSWFGWLTGAKREASAGEHNSKEGATLYSPYTSWTTDIDVAVNFALRPQKSPRDRNKQNGVVLTIRVETYEAIKTENNNTIKLIHKDEFRSESEYLIRGNRVAQDVEEVDLSKFKE
jgi:RHS repeat-associated protein